jgi:hypothetical protein
VNYLPACVSTVGNWCDRLVVQVHQPINLDNSVQKSPVFVASTPHTCPAKLESLTNLLVRDLPGYTNRMIQQRRSRSTDKIYSSIVTASMPDLKPIETISREYPPQFPQSVPTQVFIGTLERQYTGLQSAQLQQFHWLFLAQTRMGWRLANIYTRTSSFPSANTSISPPIESSKTVVGEAVRIWLNDCYLGKIRE